MLHGTPVRDIFCPPNTKMYVGDSLGLAPGQIGLFDMLKREGITAVDSLKGYRTDEKRFEIRQGNTKSPASRSNIPGDYATPLFSLDEVTNIFANAPQTDKAKVDIVIMGYNGIDPSTAIKAHKGDSIPVKLTLTGRALELMNYPGGKLEVWSHIHFDECNSIPNSCDPECDPCEDVNMYEPILKFIEHLKKQPVAGGKTLEDYIEITPIFRYDTAGDAVVETKINSYCMEVCDLGDNNALEAVLAQYKGLDILRVDRDGATSKYSVLSATKPADYELHLSSILKGCEDCPDNYTKVAGGLIYSVSMEDEGADLSTKVEEMANAVADTAVKADAQLNTIGMYTVVLSKKLSDADLKTFLTANPTAKVKFVAKTADMCSNPTVEKVSWVQCGECRYTTQEYTINIPDNECGDSALADIQERYPGLTITETGTPNGCQRTFKTTVKTNLLCDDPCDAIFKDYYTSEPPAPYMQRQWKKTEPTTKPVVTLAGVQFKSKMLEVLPDIYEVYELEYIEDSLEIEVTAGWLEEYREGIPIYSGGPLNVEHLQYKEDRSHLGGNMYDKERSSRMYFNGTAFHDTKFGRDVMGDEYRMSPNKQYVDIGITINPKKYSNGFGNTVTQPNTFVFHVEYGAHQGVLDFVNMIGTAAGLVPIAL